MHILLESAMGYSLFNIKEFEDVGADIPQVETSITDSSKFRKAVKFVAFKPFKEAAETLENMNSISEGLSSIDILKYI